MKSESHWKARDGTLFPRLDWQPRERCRGTVVAWHGMGGAPSDFHPLGEHLSRQGWHVAAPAVRGQGLDPSPHRRGVFLDPQVIAQDISAFSKEVFEQAKGPRVFCGESLGALLGAHALAHGHLHCDAAIFSAPVVALARPTPAWARMLLRVLARLAPRGKLRPSWFVTGGPSAPKTSRDEEWIAAQRRGPQYIPAFGFGVLEAVGRLMESMSAAAARIRTPALVLAAGQDIFVTPRQVEEWFGQLAAEDKALRVYPQAYHVLWNDWDREQVLTDIANWLGSRSPARR